MRVIFIEKLFGEHNIEIDLDAKLNIMIGENGIGKTTILNIIQLLYQQDFVSLTKFNFRRIALTTEVRTLEITKADLFPELKVMINEIKNSIDNNYETMVAFNKFSSELTNTLQNKTSIYYEFLSACFFDLPLSNRVSHNIDTSNYHGNSMIFDPQDYLRSVMSSKVAHTKYYKKNSRYFLNSKISEYLMLNNDFKSGLEKFFSSSVVSLNMVNKYALKENSISKPPIYSNMILWLNEFKRVSSRDRIDESFKVFTYSYDDKLDELISCNQENRIGLPESTPSKYAEEYLSIFKKAYTDVEYNFFDLKKDINKIIDEVRNEKVVDVNGIINRFIYSEEYMKEINNKAISYYSDIIGQRYEYSDFIDAYTEFSGEEEANIINYIQPLIIDESIFSTTISQISDPRPSNFDVDIIVHAFRRFYDENINDIINAIDPKIKELERLLNEFITSKTFIITPAGLKIYLKKYKEYESGNFKVIENDTNEIRMMDLSSGEKKLIIILIFSCIFDNLLLLMDEPEISFSINWQERIIESMIEQNNDNAYLIATHSPFIVSNEEIYESIVPLPLED
jgi:predicted ATPase